MKVKIEINDVKTGSLIVERIADIAKEGDVAQEVSIAVNEARKKGMEPFGWMLRVDKA